MVWNENVDRRRKYRFVTEVKYNVFMEEQHKKICYDEEGSLVCVCKLAENLKPPITDEELSMKLAEHTSWAVNKILGDSVIK